MPLNAAITIIHHYLMQTCDVHFDATIFRRCENKLLASM